MSNKKQRYEYCPTCNNNPTHIIHKINRVPFRMPLSVKGKVDRGKCLVCSPSTSYCLKDPPEDQLPPLPTTTTLCPVETTECTSKKTTTTKPKFKSDRDALIWFQEQQQQQQQQQLKQSSTSCTSSKSLDQHQLVPADQTPAVSTLAHEAANGRQDSNHPMKESITTITTAATEEKESSSPNSIDRRRTTQLRVKVTTSAAVRKKQSAYITLNLDPASPPSDGHEEKSSSHPSADNERHSGEQLLPRKNGKKSKEKPKSPRSSARNTNNKRSSAPQRQPQKRSARTASQRSKPRIEGTQLQFHKIMKKNNAASKEMLRSLLVAAVLSRKNDNLSGSDEYFLGADGRYYPDLRSNFGKYADLKQCAVCKQRVQGAYYCRLKCCHLEVPDWDGADNSAKCLKELFRKDVHELEMIQRRYAGEDDGGDYDTVGNSREGGQSSFRGSEWSVDQLNDDLLQHVASYIPSLRGLVTFCATSKRAHSILTRDGARSESLLRGIYQNKYGERGAQGNYDIHMTWRERWIMIYNLKHALQCWPREPTSAEVAAANFKFEFERGDPNSPAATSGHLRNTIGVLSEQDERSAIYYDNQHLNEDPEADTCNGYFGLHILELAPPPNVIENWQPPVLLHGDFNGIKIFDSLHHAIVKPEEEDQTQGARFISLGDDLLGGQVLSIIHCDYARDDSANNSICCFLGYASGRVAAVSRRISQLCGTPMMKY